MSALIPRLLGHTDPARRRIGVAALVGLIAGMFSAIVKFGWEVPFPPARRNVTPRTHRRRCWSCGSG